MKNELRKITRLVRLSLAALCLQPVVSPALTVTAVTSDNGYPAHEIQWTDSAGLPRTAIMVDQNPTTPPYTGYLRRYIYQANGVNRICTGTENYAAGGNLEFSGDGFVQNHTAGGGDFSSGNGAGVPGTTTITLLGTNFVMIQYSMPNYEIDGPYYNPAYQVVPTTVQWFFADGRSHPVFAISQDARNAGGNMGADSRSPYGDMAYDGDGTDAYVGGCSYGDTYKFVTLAANPEEVTTNSGWQYTQTNFIPYAMQWANPATVDAEMGHVATLPILLSDQGMDSQYFNGSATLSQSFYQDNRDLAQAKWMIGDQTWAYQIFAQNPIWSEPPAPIQSKRLTWGANWGRVGGFDGFAYGGSGIPDIDLTNYTQHSTDPVGNPINNQYKGTGNPADGSLMAYSIFVVLGTHTGGYTNGTVGQQVIQMQNVTHASLAASIGAVTASGPAGVGNATARTITYSPAGFDPTYATWELNANTNTANATLTVNPNYPLDHPVFVVNNYATNRLPAVISVGAGLTNMGVNYFASVDTNGHRLWITVNRLVTNSLNLVVTFAGGAVTQPAPTVSSFSPASGAVGALVTITGQNLTNATSVAFNGVAAVSYTINSATQITATVPVGATTGTISVTTPGGTASSTASFTVKTVPAPVIASFSPASGAVGTSVTITGQNLTNATTVAFNGVAAASPVINTAGTQITATVPAGATTGTISVTTPGGTTTSAATFTVVSAVVSWPIYNNSLVNGFADYGWATDNDANTSPVYTGCTYSISVSATAYSALSLYHVPFNTAPFASFSFWINGGAAGAPGLQVVGVTNLPNGNQNEAVVYNLPNLAANTWTQFNLPLSSLGVANTTNCSGFWLWPTSSGTTTFYVDSVQLDYLIPGLTSFSPASGAVGTAVTITGTNFIGVASVAFNGVAAASFNVNSAATQITTTVPVGATTGLISVTTAGGTAGSATTFTVPVIADAPAISSFSPVSGTVGTLVTITGSNFTGATNVAFDGVAATNFAVSSATQITVTVPAGASTGPITVSTPVSAAASAAAFTVPANGTFINGMFVKGANLPWLDGQYDHDIGTSPENDYACQYNSAHINQYLGDLHNMGITVVRLWLNEDKQGLVLNGSGDVTGLQPTFLANLDNIVQLAATNGIKLYLTLNEGEPAWLTNATEQASYLNNAIIPLATRYKGSRQIFAYDVMNEIDGVVDSEEATWAQAQAYVSAAVSALHSADPGRLATCSVGYLPAWPTLVNLKGLGMDFYDFHDYEDVPALPTAASLGLDKPVLIGECGQATATWNDAIQSTCELDYLNSAKANGYAGAEIWAYQYPGCSDYLTMVNTNDSWRPVCTNILDWNYQPLPVVTSLSPASGAAGTSVTISGQNFTNATTVAFNGVAVTAFTIDSATQITATAPAGVTTGPVSVTTFGGPAQSATSFTVSGGVPVIASFSPTNGVAGTAVVITGSNFTGATDVTFAGFGYLSLNASFIVNSATEITATVPAGAMTGTLSVTTPGGTAYGPAIFTVTSAPANVPIYANGLTNSFRVAFQEAAINLANTAPVYSTCTYSISVALTSDMVAGEPVFGVFGSPEFNTTPYTSLGFWINGGPTGLSGLQVSGWGDLYQLGTYHLPPLAANTWTQFNIPLPALGVADIGYCDGFAFDVSNAVTATFYLDAIQLNVAGAPTLGVLPGSTTPHAFVMQLAGSAGQTYWLETSTNLINWTSVSTNVLTSGTVNLTNAFNAGYRSQFWRVAWPQ